MEQAPKQESNEVKTVAKPAGKAAGKKTKQPETKAAQVDDEVLADPVAEKLRQQRCIYLIFYLSKKSLIMESFFCIGETFMKMLLRKHNHLCQRLPPSPPSLFSSEK